MKKVKIPSEHSYKKHADMIKSIFKRQINEKLSFWGGDIEKVIYEYFYKDSWRMMMSYYHQMRKIYKINKCYLIIDESPFFMLIWDYECKYLLYYIEKSDEKYIRIWALGVKRESIKKVEYQDIIVNNEFGSTCHPFFELMSEKWVDKIVIHTAIRNNIRPVPVKDGWGEGKILKWYEWSK